MALPVVGRGSQGGTSCWGEAEIMEEPVVGKGAQVAPDIKREAEPVVGKDDGDEHRGEGQKQLGMEGGRLRSARRGGRRLSAWGQ